jgi:hypothetical protein
VDELERGGPFQQRDTEPSPPSNPEKSFTGEEQPPRPEGEDVDAGSQVMGRLPRTRPQRRSDRRPTSTAKSNAGTAKTNAATGNANAGTANAKAGAHKAGATPSKKPASRSRPRASSGARSASATARPRATGGHAARRRPAETATRVAARKRAPGIPQLAAGAAVNAAKLPLKVTASVARQATKLIGRGLRLR